MTGSSDLARAFEAARAWFDREAAIEREAAQLSAAVRRLFARQERLLAKAIAERLGAKIETESITIQRALESINPSDFEKPLDDVLEETEGDLLEPFETAAGAALTAGGTHVFRQLQLEAVFTFNRENELIQQYLRQSAARLVTNVSATTRYRMRRAIVRAVEEGKGWPEISKLLRTRFQNMRAKKPQRHIKDRADLIAITELGNAFEFGGHRAAGDLTRGGIAIEKFWSNTGDERVSDGCLVNTDAGWIPQREAFPSGHQHPLRFPGCRCATLRRLAQPSET